MFAYKTSGVCATEIHVDIKDNVIENKYIAVEKNQGLVLHLPIFFLDQLVSL